MLLRSSRAGARSLNSVHAPPTGREFQQPSLPRYLTQKTAVTARVAVPDGNPKSVDQSRLKEEKKSQTLSKGSSGIRNGKDIKLLTPYALSQRLRFLCHKGGFKEAISELEGAPRDAQNSIVWGSLIHEVMTAGKYKQGYRLFTDMKRRGIVPTTRTYGTVLGGYARIENWDEYSLQLGNVYSLYDQLKQHHAHGGDPSTIPYTLLIKIFGQAQQFQRMYDVFNAMPSKGPLAPDIYTYTTLLNAIANRKLSALDFPTSDSTGDEEPSYNELLSKKAQDAKLIWHQLLRASAKSPELKIDSHVLHALLKILARGRSSDQSLAFDIAHEYLGLPGPGQTAIPAKVELHAQLLESLLCACNNAMRYDLTLHYAKLVIDSDSGPGRGDQRLGMRRILNRRHMDLLLAVHAALASTRGVEESQRALETLEWMQRMQAVPPAAGKRGGIGSQIRPEASTYELVLLACWRSADWSGACRAFEFMTGYNADDFRGNIHKPPTPEKRSLGRALSPSAAFMSSMIRTASKTGRAEDAQQALNIFEHYGWDTFFRLDIPEASRRQRKDHGFYSSKLAEALANLIPLLTRSKLWGHDKSVRARWKALGERAASVVRPTSHPAEGD